MPFRPAVELVKTIAPPWPRSIIVGIAVSTVLNTPVRLTSMTSCQRRPLVRRSTSARCPALASTMSTGPSSAVPASNACLQRGQVADVGLRGDDPAVQGLDLLGRLREVGGGRHGVGDAVDLLADVDGDDVGAFLGEPDRVAAALAACRTSDESDLAFKLSHDLAFLSFACPGHCAFHRVGLGYGASPGGRLRGPGTVREPARHAAACRSDIPRGYYVSE